ncbi:MAG: class I SAM-dependent methyltransferase [Bacteroidales bacterium]|nr:class I SAM-dependent methyltransferase [Bacteroidales bacterium]
MRNFEFQEFDTVGEETLEAIGKADRFNLWMYQTIKPWCKGRTLEIGSGAGNMSKYFIEDHFNIMLTDIRDSYCLKLEEKFTGHPNLLGVMNIDLADPEFDKKHRHIFDAFDTVFALNVVEHIKDDLLAIQNSRKLLKNGGHLIVLVPSYQTFYNRFDVSLGHYRRYTRKSLTRVFKHGEFEVIHKQHFNFVGLFGWFFSGSILRKEIIPAGQVRIFNRLVPLFKMLDTALFHHFGLSTIVVGRK